MSPEERTVLESVLRQEVVFEHLPLNQISIDMEYQDRPRKTLVGQIATQFSEVMFGHLIVSKRPNGTYWVVDGATRKLGLEAGGQNNREVRCQIIRTEGQKQEALLFKHYNCNRKMVPLANRLNAEGVAGISGLVDVVKKCGFQLIGNSKKTLKGISFLVQAYNFDEGKSLERALYSMKSCWDGRHRLDGGNILGAAALYHSQRKTPDKQVRKVLLRKGPDDIEQMVQLTWGKGSRKVSARLHPADRWKFVAKALLFEINKATRNEEDKLDIDKLNELIRH
jgi:hypothetical protein